MSFLLSFFVVLHIICFAVALGTWVAAARTREPNPGMAHAVAGALVIGVVLAALVSIDGSADHLKIGLKLIVALIATVLAFIARRRGPQTPSAIWYGIPVAIVANIVIAVFV